MVALPIADLRLDGVVDDDDEPEGVARVSRSGEGQWTVSAVTAENRSKQPPAQD